MFRSLLPVADKIYLARPDDERGLDAAELRDWLMGQGLKSAQVRLFSSPSEALHEAKRQARPDDLIVVAGSLYTVGEILAAQAR
jgi:folylpolyglutamate synthase/dihydropteroate synthase